MQSAPNHDDELIPTRQSLLSRLKNWEDQDSWKVFFDTYWRLIYSTGRRAGLTDAEAQDAVQDTVISVLKSMPGFKYDAENGSFKAWLLQLTSWRINDQIRKRQRRIESPKPGACTDDGTEIMERVPDPAAEKVNRAWDEEWEKNLMVAAIERVKRKVDPKQYQIFDLYVFKHWPVVQVARTLNINAARVYLTKHRISNLIRKEIEYLQSKPV